MYFLLLFVWTKLYELIHNQAPFRYIYTKSIRLWNWTYNLIWNGHVFCIFHWLIFLLIFFVYNIMIDFQKKNNSSSSASLLNLQGKHTWENFNNKYDWNVHFTRWNYSFLLLYWNHTVLVIVCVCKAICIYHLRFI